MASFNIPSLPPIQPPLPSTSGDLFGGLLTGYQAYQGEKERLADVEAKRRQQELQNQQNLLQQQLLQEQIGMLPQQQAKMRLDLLSGMGQIPPPLRESYAAELGKQGIAVPETTPTTFGDTEAFPAFEMEYGKTHPLVGIVKRIPIDPFNPQASTNTVLDVAKLWYEQHASATKSKLAREEFEFDKDIRNRLYELNKTFTGEQIDVMHSKLALDLSELTLKDERLREEINQFAETKGLEYAKLTQAERIALIKANATMKGSRGFSITSLWLNAAKVARETVLANGRSMKGEALAALNIEETIKIPTKDGKAWREVNAGKYYDAVFDQILQKNLQTMETGGFNPKNLLDAIDSPQFDAFYDEEYPITTPQGGEVTPQGSAPRPPSIPFGP